MNSCRPPLFRKRQFEPTIIVTCVRWYLRFSLSLRDVEELMAERGLSVDHTTVWRWTQAYAPEIRQRLQNQVKIEAHDVVHGRDIYKGGRPVDVSFPRRRRPRPNR